MIINVYPENNIIDVSTGEVIQSGNTIDFDDLTLVTAPNAADMFLIGDSENSYELKKASLENLLTSQ